MTTAFGRFKASALLVLLAGYFIFNYPFMQLRIPPVGFGLPLGELFLVLVLVSSDLPRIVARMNAVVFLPPFLIWWGWGIARLMVDMGHGGFWAFRDATQLIESLYVIVGFTVAGQPDMVTRLSRWLRAILIISCLYGLLFSYGDEIAAISPTLPGGSEQAIAIFGNFNATGTLMLWGAFFLMIQPAERPALRLRNALVAGFLIAFALLVLQARTTYTQILGLAGLMFLLRPRMLGPFGSAIPVLFALLIVISAFDIPVAGRLTSHVSLQFFWDHVQSIVGGGGDKVANAAEGVDLRLGWWLRLYDQLTSDAAKLITGLGYGIPLTDFSDTLGVVTREPHNSFISVAARLGLIGIVAWLWMQAELLRAGFVAYRACRRKGWNEGANLVFLVLAFAVLSLVGCLGEDVMEKPYNAIPYYALWGFALRIAYQLRVEAAQVRRAGTGLKVVPNIEPGHHGAS